MSPRLSIVVPSHDSLALTIGCLASIPEDSDLEVLLVDDGSRDGTEVQVAIRFPAVKILRSEVARGFSAAANQGIAAASGERILLLNSDAILLPGALDALAEALDEDPALGVVGASLQNVDGTGQWSGGEYPSARWLGVLTAGFATWLNHWRWVRRLRAFLALLEDPLGPLTSVQWVSGAAMLLRREALESAAPAKRGRWFDEGFGFYGQDLDLCRRVAARGWRVGVARKAKVIHIGGGSIVRQAGAIRNPEGVGPGWLARLRGWLEIQLGPLLAAWPGGSGLRQPVRRSTPGGVHPELLWRDLLSCVARHEGPASAERARHYMLMGARLRLRVRSARRIFLPPADRADFDAITARYLGALEVLESFSLGDSSP